MKLSSFLFHFAQKRVPKYPRRLAGMSFCCLQVLLSMSPTICAQNPSVEARFRQATDALRAGHLDEAGDQFASIAKTRLASRKRISTWASSAKSKEETKRPSRACKKR